MTETTYDFSTFSKEGKIEDVKIGTEIWFKYKLDTDVGVVIADERNNVRAKWYSGTSQTVGKEGFNRYWGIILEKKEEKPPQQQNRHKYYDVILHWANGGEIQYLVDDIWLTFTGELTPAFFSYEWRIKPKIKILRYRNALLKNNEVVVLTSEPTLEDAYGPTTFLRWIDPEWKQIEVEI